MAITPTRILLVVIALGLFNATLSANLNKFKIKTRLNVGAPEESGNSTDSRKFRLNLGAPEEIGNYTRVLKKSFLAIGVNEIDNSARQYDSGLNVGAPEEIGRVVVSAVVGDDVKVIGNKIFPSQSNSDLNVGVPGDLESPGLYGGDLILTPEQEKQWKQRKAVTFGWLLWPKISGYPTVTYSIGNTKVPTTIIDGAIADYEQNTCIRFQKAWFIHIGPKINFVDSTGCSSMIGRQFLTIFGGQPINLAEGCGTVSIVVHEIGHAVGLYHEQSRSDRDGYVTVISSNIQSGMEGNFYKQSTNNYDTPYDYFSVMQYGPLSFSINGGTTLSANDPMAQGLMILTRSGLSFMDKRILNRMYGCVDLWVSKCPGISSDPCQNLGYLGSGCTCVCPAGTSGNNCQTKTMSYTEALIAEKLPNNERLTAPGTVTTAGYPTPQNSSQVFTKIIDAPNCQNVKLTVDAFDMFARSSSQRCSKEGVEIRLGDPVTSGTWYCGTELKAGDILVSEGNTLVLFYIKSAMVTNTKVGFSFTVTFEPDSTCR